MINTRTTLLVFIGAIGIIVVAMLAIAFTPYISTRVASGLSFRILGPSVIKTGELVTITWNASSESATRYPYEKIEFCPGKTNLGCIQLSAAVPNNGRAIVKVPMVKATKGYIKLTARDTSKKLLWLLSSWNAVRVVPGKAIVVIRKSARESGGDSGGGNDERGSDPVSSPISTPLHDDPSIVFASPVSGSSVPIGSPLQVRATMTYSSANPMTCQMWLLDGKQVVNAAWSTGVPPC